MPFLLTLYVRIRTIVFMTTKKDIKKKIRRLMIDNEITAGDIAREVGCTRQNVNHIIGGRHRTPYVRQAIATALGVQVSDLWPDETPQRAA